MTKIIAALAFGYLLVALEAIVPGGILGLLGFVCLGRLLFCPFGIRRVDDSFGCLHAWRVWGVLLVFFQFKWLSQSKFGKNMFVHSTSGTTSTEDTDLKKWIGKHGITETDHHPEGLVRVDGRNF